MDHASCQLLNATLRAILSVSDYQFVKIDSWTFEIYINAFDVEKVHLNYRRRHAIFSFFHIWMTAINKDQL